MVWPSPWFVNSEFWPWQIWGILVKTLVCHGPAKSYKKLVIVLVPTQKRWDNFDPSISGQDPGRRVNTTIAGAARSDLSHWDHRISWILSLQTVDGWLRCFPYPPLIKAGNESNNSSKKSSMMFCFLPMYSGFPSNKWKIPDSHVFPGSPWPTCTGLSHWDRWRSLDAVWSHQNCGWQNHQNMWM